MANLLLKRINDWATRITAFRTGDVIPVDGPSGTAKMSKDDLLKEAAENTLSSIKSIDSCATEDDIKAGNYFAIDGADGTKRLGMDTLLATTDESAVKTSKDVRNYLSMLSLGESVVKYVDGAGSLDDAGDRNRHFVVAVDTSKTYIVRTRLGSSTMWIAGGDTADQTTGLVKYKNDSVNYGSFQEYEITPTKGYLFISFTTPSLASPYTQRDFECFIVDREVYARDIGRVKKSAKDTMKELNRELNATKFVAVGSSSVLYVDGAGNLADAGDRNRHFVVPVSSGNTYKVRTRLGSSTMWIAGGDTADQTTGLVKYKNDSINYGNFVDYIIKATKPYLFISFYTPSLTSPYTQSDVFVNIEDITDSNGIVPNRFMTDGFRPQSSANKLSSSGLIVCYNHRTPNKKLSRIRFNASGDGFIRFGVGLIDQRNWAIISQTIDVPCKTGYNDVDVLKFGLDFQQGGYLFAYNNADGNGTCVTYTIVTSGNLYGMFFSETPSSAINKTINSSGVIINASLGRTNSNVQANMSWDALDESLLYRLDSEALADKAWNERTINAVAQAKGTKNLIASGRSKYKISQSSGSLLLSPFKFNAVTIYGNSIFLSGESSRWLYPQIVGGVTYTYTNEPDPQSMGGMRGRGMSATRQGVDFKHIFRDAVQALNPTTIVRGASVADVERGNPDGTFKTWPDTGYGYLCDSTNDLIIWAAGENVIRKDDAYYSALCSWVEYWQTRSPNALIVLCGGYWKNDVCDYITYRVAQKYDLPFVWKRMDEDTQSRADQIVIYPAKESEGNEVELVGRVNAGVGHPSDVGMYRIARLMLETVGVECPDLEHKIVCQNSTTDLVHIPKTWVYGGIVSIEMNGSSSRNISVVTASGTSVSVNIKAKSEIGSACDYVAYFDMPNEDVLVTFN